MIDKKPTPGDLTHWVMEPYEADSGPGSYAAGFMVAET